MAWFKVDDGWWSHPKTLRLSAPAIALWARAGSWSCQHLTDGLIPDSALPMVGGSRKAAAELVAVGYWSRVGGGWLFHDWEDYQEHSDLVKRRRADARERMRRVRANKGRTFGDTSEEVRSTPTRPDPTRPVDGLSQSSYLGDRAREDDELAATRAAIFEGMGITDHERIHREISLSTGRDIPPDQLLRLVVRLLNRAPTQVKNPQRYAIACIRDSWADVQKLIDEDAA